MYKLFIVLNKNDLKKALLEPFFSVKTYFKPENAQKLYILPKTRDKFGLAQKYNFFEKVRPPLLLANKE